MQAENSRPPILCFGGLDPSGGAGLQADIETISHCGGHALPIATCLTVQNTTQTSASTSVEPKIIQQQTEALLSDINPAACKIGVVPNQPIATIIANILAQIPDIPIVLDPVLSASSGISFVDKETIHAIKRYLLPNATVITPNANELKILADSTSSDKNNAQTLCALGPKYVLVTRADRPTDDVTNTLYSKNNNEIEFHSPRLPHTYHGSGCTLSSAISCFLAHGLNIADCIDSAQEFTYRSLQHAEPLGKGQWIPKRAH